MQLVTNELAPDEVEHISENGTEFLKAPVVMARAMQLNGGYLPQSELNASKDQWDGVPVPVSHPEHNGRPISVESDRADTPVIGEIRNPEVNGDKLTGDLFLNLDDAKEATAGAQKILNNLLTGESVEVSTAYAVGETISGNIDGQYREKAVKNIDPDHLAVLPNETGKCSVADGCGAPVANQLFIPHTDDGENPEEQPMRTNKTVDGIEFTGTADGNLDESEIPNDDYASHYVFPEDTKSASSFPLVDADGNLRAGNVASAFRFRDDAPDTERLVNILESVNDEFDDPPIDPENFKDMSSNSAFARVKSFLGIVDNDAGGNSGVEDTSAMTNDTEKHDYLVENHGYDRENLPPEGSECLDMMHENHEQLANMESNDGGGEGETVEVNKDELDELVDKRVEERFKANEQSELVDEIMANSDDYEREVLEDTPESVLEDIHNDVTSEPAANMPANVGRKEVTNSDEEYSGPTDFGEYLSEAE